jgi:hypothetical protein
MSWKQNSSLRPNHVRFALGCILKPFRNILASANMDMVGVCTPLIMRSPHALTGEVANQRTATIDRKPPDGIPPVGIEEVIVLSRVHTRTMTTYTEVKINQRLAQRQQQMSDL